MAFNMMTCEGECACEHCGQQFDEGDRAYGQEEEDGSITWRCEDCESILSAIHFAPVGMTEAVCDSSLRDVRTSNHRDLVTCSYCLDWLDKNKQE